MTEPNEPTSEQCSANAEVGKRMWAAWYPQMGGYVGKCVVEDLGGCFDVWVWHDGEFAFGGEQEEAPSPAHLHHCDPEQFIRFGETVKRLQGGG